MPKDELLLDHERFLSVRVRRWINIRLADGHPAPIGGKPADSEVFWPRWALGPITETGEKKEQQVSGYTLHADDDTTVRPNPGGWSTRTCWCWPTSTWRRRPRARSWPPRSPSSSAGAAG